ncbi:MAG: pyridoxamine 5'-phosphate oxidase family protein [Candidatus Curtissbacteria bacterium]
MGNSTRESLIAWEFLRKNRLAVLATFSVEKGTPQAALVYYIVDDSFKIYIAASKNSSKVKNIMAYENVALVVAQEVEPEELQIEGTASFVNNPAHKSQIMELIVKVADDNPKSKSFMPLVKLARGSGVEFIEIRINHFRYSIFNDKKMPYIIESTPRDWQQS